MRCLLGCLLLSFLFSAATVISVAIAALTVTVTFFRGERWCSLLFIFAISNECCWKVFFALCYRLMEGRLIIVGNKKMSLKLMQILLISNSSIPCLNSDKTYGCYNNIIHQQFKNLKEYLRSYKCFGKICLSGWDSLPRGLTNYTEVKIEFVKIV